MEDKIKLFLKYMKADTERMIEFDKEDGIDVDKPDYKPFVMTIERVKAFISYRNIRIEEAWFQKLNKGKVSREIAERSVEYDQERSRRHEIALNSLNSFNKVGEDCGLEKFYEGELLSREDIKNYKNIDLRYEATAFFLQFIDALGRTTGIKMKEYFDEVGIEPNKTENNFIRELQSNISKAEDDYGVDQPLLEEDGETIFKDEKDFGMQLD